MIGDEIYKELLKAHLLGTEDFVAPRLRNTSLFEFIVAVMLSQNTSDRNALKAYTNLKSKLGSVTPSRVLEVGVEELADLIRIAGMHYERARRIRELAEVFLRRDVDNAIRLYIEQGDVNSARKELMGLSGVGYKTADVVLLMYYGVPVFPVDTHIARITRRLGYAKSGNYEEIRKFWMENTSPNNYLKLHLLLIAHGRKTCKARKPKCWECPINGLCGFNKGMGI
ncbi:MAG: endonuclease III [Desulfurococcaceae archaeon]